MSSNARYIGEAIQFSALQNMHFPRRSATNNENQQPGKIQAKYGPCVEDYLRDLGVQVCKNCTFAFNCRMLTRDRFLFFSILMRQNERYSIVSQYKYRRGYQITRNACQRIGQTIRTSTFWVKWSVAYLCFWTSKRYKIEMKSIYSGLLIHPNFASRRRFDRLSKGISRSHSSTNPGLYRNFSSSKSNPYGFCLMS
jgi:hypothetical protein